MVNLILPSPSESRGQGREASPLESRPGLFILTYLLSKPEYEATIQELHRAYKQTLGWYMGIGYGATNSNSAAGHKTRKIQEKLLRGVDTPTAQLNNTMPLAKREAAMTISRPGRKAKHRHAATYESFKAFVHHIKRLGWIEPTGRVERDMKDQMSHGQWQQVPEKYVPYRAVYRLTEAGISHPAADWLKARSFTRTVFIPFAEIVTEAQPAEAGIVPAQEVIVTRPAFIREEQIQTAVNFIEQNTVPNLKRIKKLIRKASISDAQEILNTVLIRLNIEQSRNTDLLIRANSDQRIVLSDLINRIEKSKTQIALAIAEFSKPSATWDDVEEDIQHAISELQSPKQREEEQVEPEEFGEYELHEE